MCNIMPSNLLRTISKLSTNTSNSEVQEIHSNPIQGTKSYQRVWPHSRAKWMTESRTLNSLLLIWTRNQSWVPKHVKCSIWYREYQFTKYMKNSQIRWPSTAEQSRKISVKIMTMYSRVLDACQGNTVSKLIPISNRSYTRQEKCH